MSCPHGDVFAWTSQDPTVWSEQGSSRRCQPPVTWYGKAWHGMARHDKNLTRTGCLAGKTRSGSRAREHGPSQTSFPPLVVAVMGRQTQPEPEESQTNTARQTARQTNDKPTTGGKSMMRLRGCQDCLPAQPTDMRGCDRRRGRPFRPRSRSRSRHATGPELVLRGFEAGRIRRR